MNNINYQKQLDKLIHNNIKEGIKPTLLLHACCAPCSSYVLEYLTKYFEITVDFYNPNISPKEEYDYRAKEISRLIKEMKVDVKLIIEEYDNQIFEDMANGLEEVPEGGVRCFKCYELRLRNAAKRAKEGNFDYFTTTLSISPLKNSQKLNEIGKKVSDEYGVDYLFSDFKKKEGYKGSVELSKIYNLYRQNFCGCKYSKSEVEKREQIEQNNYVATKEKECGIKAKIQ
ncbi:MAG: epoxyqueuosine reductase QueH [Lachnospiraceae bacterium]|nr:epoxyqueuosine reductase QueH [Lachnospiraceae bacterium]